MASLISKSFPPPVLDLIASSIAYCKDWWWEGLRTRLDDGYATTLGSHIILRNDYS